MVDQPLDILFALEQVASNPPPGLEGVFDADNAGALGYSYDGYNALALSGARFDPEYYLSLCADPAKTVETVGYSFYENFHCGAARQWEQLAAAAGEAITTSSDGLWQPMTDPRIKAVMPMGADGLYIFGEKGLAQVKMPVLLLAATQAGEYPENTLILDALGSADKSLITVVGRTHGIIFEPDMQPILRHFIVAFFGHQLQGRQDYAQFYSEDFVNQQKKLVWGKYTEP
jgi:predicted dienelactone hydrolase